MLDDFIIVILQKGQFFAVDIIIMMSLEVPAPP